MRDVSRRVRPDADDAAGNGNALGCLEQRGDLFDKAVTGPAREPQSSVAQLLQLGSGTRRDIVLAIAQSRAPNTNATQVHLRLLVISSGAMNLDSSVIPSGARNLRLQR